MEPATPNLVRLEINSSLPKGLKLGLNRRNLQDDGSANSDDDDFEPKTGQLGGGLVKNSVSKNLLMKNRGLGSDSDEELP